MKRFIVVILRWLSTRISKTPSARIYATSIVLSAVMAGEELSVHSHQTLAAFMPKEYWKYFVAFASCVTYGAGWLMTKCPLGIQRVLAVTVLAVLGTLAVLQSPEQLSAVGFAASNRNPDMAAAMLGLGCGALALWQIAGNFTEGRWLSNRLVVTVLALLNVYLFFAAW